MSDTDSNSDQEDWKCDPADLMWEPPCSLRLSYWKRNAETQQAKDDHVDYLETLPFSREELILKTTLRDADIAIEKNMFPYATPPNIEHWTLWSREELSHRSICRFIEDWCEEAKDPVAKQVVEWNYEENAHRSFDVPHVHVFLRLRDKEVYSSGLNTDSNKRSFSSLNETKSSSSSSPLSASFLSNDDADSDISSDAPRKKVCAHRHVNLLSTSSTSSSSPPDSVSSEYEEGETDGEDFSDTEPTITKKKLCLPKTSLRVSGVSSSEEGLTDTEDDF